MPGGLASVESDPDPPQHRCKFRHRAFRLAFVEGNCRRVAWDAIIGLSDGTLICLLSLVVLPFVYRFCEAR